MVKLILRVKAFPWALLVEAGLIARGRWRSMPERERRQLIVLAQRSRGWPGNLSAGERAEVWRLLVRLNVRDLAGEIVALRSATRSTRKLRAAQAARVARIARQARRGR